MGSGLHLLIHQEDMAFPAGLGKERGAKRETVDFAAHAAPLSDRPDFCRVEWDADCDPIEGVTRALESCAKGLGLGGRHRTSMHPVSRQPKRMWRKRAARVSRPDPSDPLHYFLWKSCTAFMRSKRRCEPAGDALTT